MDKVIEQVKIIAMKYNIEKVILFGSRARGDYTTVSDYDIAVFKKDLSALDRASFYADIEEIDTLKKIDIVFVNNDSTDELIENINKDGVVIWAN